MANKSEVQNMVSDLLHDADLESLHFDPEMARIELNVDCLRAKKGVEENEVPAVAISLSGVECLILWLDVAHPGESFDHLGPDLLSDRDVLEDWPGEGQEVEMAFNSVRREVELDTAPVRRLLFGDEVARFDAGDLQHCFLTQSFVPLDNEVVNLGLYIAFDEIKFWDGAVPLDIRTWEQQFRAWWSGWSEHHEGNVASGKETHVLPLAEPLTVAHDPPKRPAWNLLPTDLPGELENALRDYFEGTFERDWERVTRAIPNFSMDWEDEVNTTRESLSELRSQEWHYIRQIDDWWIDKRRASVTLRGIEHLIQTEEGKNPENREFVMTLDLRQYRDQWYIWSFSLGWPKFGSAEALEERPAWLEEWD